MREIKKPEKPARLRARADIGILQSLIAIALIAIGVGMFSIPVALIVVGVLILIDRVT